MRYVVSLLLALLAGVVTFLVAIEAGKFLPVPAAVAFGTTVFAILRDVLLTAGTEYVQERRAMQRASKAVRRSITALDAGSHEEALASDAIEAIRAVRYMTPERSWMLDIEMELEKVRAAGSLFDLSESDRLLSSSRKFLQTSPK